MTNGGLVLILTSYGSMEFVRVAHIPGFLFLTLSCSWHREDDIIVRNFPDIFFEIGANGIVAAPGLLRISNQSQSPFTITVTLQMTLALFLA